MFDLNLNGSEKHIVEKFSVNGRYYYITIANNRFLLEEVYKFIYSTYQKKGLGKPNKQKMWYTLTDLYPNTVNIIVISKNNIVASISSTSDSVMGLTVENYFENEISKRRKKGEKLSEIFSLVIDVPKKDSRYILGKLFNYISIINYNIFKNTNFVITVRPEHSVFYEKKMLFKKHIEYGFHKKTGVKCNLLTGSVRIYLNLDNKQKSKTFYNYYMSREEELKKVELLKFLITPLSVDDFIYFCNKKPEILNNLDGDKWRYLRNCIGDICGIKNIVEGGK